MYAAKHKDYSRRLAALNAIKELDQKQFDALLLAAIESLPRDVTGCYSSCPEASIAGLATQCSDPHIWPTLESVAKRSAVGLRLEMLHRLNDCRDDRCRAERLQLLAAFLDDDASRIEGSGQFDGLCAGFLYKRLEVRDFAALELAELLGIDIEVKLDRTPEEWAKVRERVREALKREQDKPRADSAGPSRPKD